MSILTNFTQRFNLNQIDFSWPRVVSNVLSPPVIWAVLAFPIAFYAADTRSEALLWALIYDVIVCGVPVLYIAWLVWRGQITDIHVPVREQRIRPFLVTLICILIALAVLIALEAPPLLPVFAFFSFVQISIMLVITLLWKISMHAMSISGAVVAVGALFGLIPALLLSPLIPIVAAARVKLRRHTVRQVIAGGLLGALMTTPLVLVINAQI
ncbi:MAG: hypothetical protein GYB67_15035 [Chloroflexi bacterium]|nr:hypothetical protein [Chloroflexota bacterium]